MSRVSDYQFSFNAGEWSPATWGRIDLAKRKMALAKALNLVPLLQGASTRRPGTYFVEPAKTNSANVRLKAFVFSVAQSYILEFGNLYVRFFTNQGQLLNGGTPYEVATPYTSAELADLGFTQSADVLYIVHPNHAPMKLERLGATNWTLTAIDFQDGPYLTRNISATYVSSSVSRTGGVGTLIAGSTQGINNGAGFTSTDVGRLFRIGTQSVNTDGTTQVAWSWGKITAVTDALHATIAMQGIPPL